MSIKRVVVHVAETELSERTGMGRVAVHWRAALVKRGYEFVHIGPAELGGNYARSLFPLLALRHFHRLGVRDPLLLLHEPVGGVFIREQRPAIVFSHGLEARGQRLLAHHAEAGAATSGLRKLTTAPLWKMRAWSAESGLRRAAALLLINEEDAAYAQARYGVPRSRMLVFRNGVNPATAASVQGPITLLFLGTWLKRKGVDVLAAAAKLVQERGLTVRWVLGGVGEEPATVLEMWPRELHACTEIIQKFDPREEAGIIARCGIYILPSYFEGQPLTLLQAMAGGRCCLASATCGQRDLIRHRANGLLHPPGDAVALAAQIEECLQNPALIATLGSAAQQSVKDRAWRDVSEEVVTFIEKVASSR